MTANYPRIVLYGVGTYGQEFARLAIRRGWPIVAALNRAGEKIGRDLGQLCGLGHDIGVVVQDCDTFEYEKIDADIGVVFVADRMEHNWPAYQRLLGAGLNVICHGSESYYPWGSDPERAPILDALAKANGVTFTGTGIWDMSRIWSGIVLAGPCTNITALFHQSITDINYPRIGIIEYGGLDLTPAEFAEKFNRQRHSLVGIYKTIPEQVMRKLGFNVTRVDEILEPVIFDEPIYSLALQRDIAPGRVVGIRFVITAHSEEGVVGTAHIELRYLRPGEIEHVIWDIAGEPGNRMMIERRDSITASSASVLNRIPDVIAAAPGIQVMADLGPMKAYLPTKK